MSKYKKVFNFGKVDFNKTGRRSNAVEVELELTDWPRGAVFSVTGSVWNANRSDVIVGGQCVDALDEFEQVHNNELFQTIAQLWRSYHLNDMHIGSPEQLDALAKIGSAHTSATYVEDCEYLKSIGLYTVMVDGTPRRYGAHFHHEIPADDLALIRQLVDAD